MTWFSGQPLSRAAASYPRSAEFRPPAELERSGGRGGAAGSLDRGQRLPANRGDDRSARIPQALRRARRRAAPGSAARPPRYSRPPGPLSEWLEASGCEVAFGDGERGGGDGVPPRNGRGSPDDVVARVDAVAFVEGDSGGEGGEGRFSVPHRDPTAEDRADRLELRGRRSGRVGGAVLRRACRSAGPRHPRRVQRAGAVSRASAPFSSTPAPCATPPPTGCGWRGRGPGPPAGFPSLRVDLECLGEGGGGRPRASPRRGVLLGGTIPGRRSRRFLDALQERDPAGNSSWSASAPAPTSPTGRR